MRNYFHIDKYLNELEKDVYYQPQHGDDHLTWAKNIIDQWVSQLTIEDVLDVGCGVGFCQPMFEQYGIKYKGITLDSEDWVDAKSEGRNVSMQDYNFIECNANTYDLVFARHALEHSPFPVLSLMEWHRVSKQHLIVVNPNPEYWGWAGRNHYAVSNLTQLKFYFERAGWLIVQDQIDKYEIWIHAIKTERKIPYYVD
jgi:SAM-dependent methyltransferase